ncbi:PrsW family intramembrane metalloprotease [Candidatus Saccharibacteria bacterium]|nr:PrsW family intramembrane metalloprotease [Candidatus Saccharibacteria bacterium]
MGVLVTILLFFGLAGFLTWYLLAKDRGEREPAGALWIALGFGFLAVIGAAFLESALLPEDILTSSGVTASNAGSMLLVGIIEESLKFVPLAFYIYRKRYFNEHTDGILYFALAGIGFGLPENILYTVGLGTGAGIGRLILTPFFHAATTAIPGYYLAKTKVEHRSMKSVFVAFGAVLLLHALYDFGLASGLAILVIVSLVITLLLSINLFRLGAIAKADDQAMGLSVVGTNTFCRSCGYPNPEHKLYCQHCGKHA